MSSKKNITETISNSLPKSLAYGKFYSHIHLSAADKEGKVFGGHLTRAVVSATCEMIVDVSDGIVERKFNEEVGLNLFEFVD